MALNEELPKWDSPGVKPPTSKLTEGWAPDEKPPAGWFNWLFNRTYKVLEQMQADIKPVALTGKYGSLTEIPSTFKATKHGLGDTTYHSAATLAQLNALVSNATLDDKTDPRTPKLHGHEAHSFDPADTDMQPHGLGSAYHVLSTLAQLNSMISNATLDDKDATRTPKIHGNERHSSSYITDTRKHGLGNGSYHDKSTLAQLNALLSDNTLDGIADARTPKAHGNEKHSTAYASTTQLSNHSGSKSNPHAVTKSQVGLGNVDNTTDLALMQKIYPIGSIYTGVKNTNPNVLFGFGTWGAFGAGRVPVGVDSTQTEFNTVKKTGGNKTESLSVAQIPAHAHTVSTGNSGEHGHTASSADAGAHGHGASSGTTGNHAHSGTTASSGTHNHTVSGVAGGAGWWSGGSGGGGDRATSSDGSHTHTFGTNTTGDHSHTISIVGTGNHSHTISVAAAGTHNHTATCANTGSGQTHNNLQPYITVYMWERTA